MLGMGALRRFAVSARRRFSRRGVILLYHRVGTPWRDPQQLSVSTANFAAQLEVMSSTGTPLSLAEFERRRSEGTLPARAIAITFDDGYVDNLTDAIPLLQHAAMCATVFVTTGALGKPFGFWWDELDALLNGAPLAEPVAFTVALDDGGARTVEVGPGRTSATYAALCDRFRAALPAERERVLTAMRETFASGRAAAFAEGEPPRSCTAPELRQLAAGGMSIGAHSVTHTTMSIQSATDLEREVRESRDTLTEIIGSAPSSFAYPFGAWSDISPAAVQAVRDAGFSMACANYPGTAWRGSDRWRAPRFIVRNWDRATFAAALDRWFDE